MPIALATPEGDNNKKEFVVYNGEIVGDTRTNNLNEDSIESLAKEGVTKKRVHLTEDFNPLNDPLLDLGE